MGPIGYPATSVRNFHYSLCNDPVERSSLDVAFTKCRDLALSDASANLAAEFGTVVLLLLTL
jgi:hypothetical protein